MSNLNDGQRAVEIGDEGEALGGGRRGGRGIKFSCILLHPFEADAGFLVHFPSKGSYTVIKYRSCQSIS